MITEKEEVVLEKLAEEAEMVLETDKIPKKTPFSYADVLDTAALRVGLHST